MSWTYSGNPSASPVDATHHLLGDIDGSNPLCTDEECVFELCQNGQNPYLAAASLAEARALTFAMRPTLVKKGDRTTMWGNPSQLWLTLARELRAKTSIRTTSVYAGGQSIAEKQADRDQTDLPQPFATRTLHTQPPWRIWERSNVDAEERGIV